MKSIEEYFDWVDPFRKAKLKTFHNIFLNDINKSKGSTCNHQFWEGGYRHHIEQCLMIAEHLYKLDVGAIDLYSIFMTIYFHDIEKLNCHRNSSFDKGKFLVQELPEKYGIDLDLNELSAIEYIHGEGDNYSKTHRTMNCLCAFCHSCDVLSARVFFDKSEIVMR